MDLLVMVAIILGAAALGVALMALLRHLRGEDSERFHDSERGSDVFAFVGTCFAVLLAFVIVQAYDYFNEARAGVEQEALSVVQINRTADFFSPDEQQRLTAAAICYGRAVVNKGFPAMAAGSEGSPVTDVWVHELGAAEQGIDLSSKVPNVAFYQLLEEQDQLTEGRRERVHAATLNLPAPVWLILGLGSFLTIGWVLLFMSDRRERFWVQACIPAAVMAFITASLLLIWVLDHPYNGDSAILPPTEMAEVIEGIEAERLPMPLPCDESGARVRAQ